MRSIIGLSALLLMAPAMAQQAPTDGKASASGKAGELVAAAGAKGFTTRAEVRALMAAILEDGRLADDEKDFLNELGAGPVTVAASGKSVALPALAANLVWVPQTLANPPNLHQLWNIGGMPAQQFVEMASWGPAFEKRMAVFIGNQLDDAWKQSNLANQFMPYQVGVTRQYKAFETLPEDPEMRGLAHNLLTTGIAISIEKAQAENRKPPEPFLYGWLAPPEHRTNFMKAKQQALPPPPSEDEDEGDPQ